MSILDTIVSDFDRYKSGGGMRVKVPGLSQLTSIIPGRLYFATTENEHYFDIYAFQKDLPFVCFFNVEFHYNSFMFDFGPYNLAIVYCFCHRLKEQLDSSSKPIVHLTVPSEQERVNSAFLIGCFAIIELNMDVRQVIEKLRKNGPHKFLPYRDASCGQCDFPLHLIDCFRAVQKASKLGILNFDNFDLKEYLHYDEVRNGDLNWIIPDEMLAFCGPVGNNLSSSIYDHPPQHYFDYFNAHNVTTIVRLNNKVYDAKIFTDAGFAHEDLFFEDGTTPDRRILDKFLEICEKSKGAIAVHCKAGLGRTGTLIACYLMKYYQFTAHEAIAWIRICRPGSILGPQQPWLVNTQQYMWLTGKGQLKKQKNNMILRRKNKCNVPAKAQEKLLQDLEDEIGSGLTRITCQVKKIAINNVSEETKDILNISKNEETEKNEEDDGEKETQGDRLNRIKQTRGKSIGDTCVNSKLSTSVISSHRHPYNTRSCAKNEVIQIPIEVEDYPTSHRRLTRSAKGSLNLLWKRVLPMRDIAFIPPEASSKEENSGRERQRCSKVRARSYSLARSRVTPTFNRIAVDSKKDYPNYFTKNVSNVKNLSNNVSSPSHFVDSKKNPVHMYPFSLIKSTRAQIPNTSAKPHAKR